MHNYANSQNDTIERYLRYYTKDPYPQIKPALLNSADIQAYVDKTGMIFPFHQEDLKPASYALRFLGDYIYWDKNGKIKQGTISVNQIFELENDSIAFVSLEPLFHIPDYIAARFNLKVDNVYKGLLLGTGPLVDPGFVGYLSFPLHNLTSNKYTFTGGEQIAWMEFTKLSENSNWTTVPTIHDYEYAVNPNFRKFVELYKNRTIDISYDKVKNFLSNAARQGVRSTIPLAITTAESSAKRSAEAAEKAANSSKNFQMITVISIAIALFLLFIQVINLNNRTYDYLDVSKETIADIKNNVKLLKNEVDSLKAVINKSKQK